MYLKIHINAVLHLVGGTRENFKIQKAKIKKKWDSENAQSLFA